VGVRASNISLDYTAGKLPPPGASLVIRKMSHTKIKLLPKRKDRKGLLYFFWEVTVFWGTAPAEN